MTNFGEPPDNVTTGEILRDLKVEIDIIKNTGERTNIEIHENLVPQVKRLWDAVFGVSFNGHSRPGLVESMSEILPIIGIVKTGILVAKWLTVTFTGAIIVGIANLMVFWLG